MVHLLFGTDDFSKKRKLKTLLHNFSERKYIEKNGELEELLAGGVQDTLFGGKVVYVMEGLLKNISTEQLEELKTYEVIIIEGEKLDKRLSATKWCLNNAQVEEFLEKNKQQTFAWIRSEGYTIEDDVKELLWERYGPNLWALKNELEKISVYGETDRKKIKEVISAPTIEENIFAFVDSVGERKVRGGLVQLEQLLSQNTDPFFILNMLGRQIRLLLLVQTKEGSKGHPPFIVSKLKDQSSVWKTKELINMHSKILAIDERVKSGVGDIVEELFNMILSVRD